MENFVPFHAKWVYQLYMAFNAWQLRRASRHIPVVVGEWCIANRKAQKLADDPAKQEECRKIFREIADMQLKVWNQTAGHIYWNYQLFRDKKKPFDESWKNGWDLSRCWLNDWISF